MFNSEYLFFAGCRELIVLLQLPKFNPAEIDDDLHKSILRTVHKFTTR